MVNTRAYTDVRIAQYTFRCSLPNRWRCVLEWGHDDIDIITEDEVSFFFPVEKKKRDRMDPTNYVPRSSPLHTQDKFTTRTNYVTINRTRDPPMVTLVVFRTRTYPQPTLYTLADQTTVIVLFLRVYILFFFAISRLEGFFVPSWFAHSTLIAYTRTLTVCAYTSTYRR
jgi:hypothetical protein